MPVVTARDTLGVPTGHLGAGTCATLNVNLGSKANPSRAGRPANASHDLTIMGGNVYVVHVEGDKTLHYPAGLGSGPISRGPYVHKWNGATLSLVGSTLDLFADTPPAVAGDRFGPRNPRIATDGTDLFVAYYDSVWDGVSTSKAHIRIAKLVGGAWTEVAQEPIQGGNDGAFGGSMISLTVAAGIAYAVYSTNSGRRVRIFRSDGTGSYVDGSDNGTDHAVGYSSGDIDGTYVAVTTSSGRPVGIYARAFHDYSGSDVVGSLVAFDLTNGSVIRTDATPMGASPLVPSGVNRQLSSLLTLTAYAVSGYGPAGDHIAFGEKAHGVLVVPEDFSSGPVVIDGNDTNLWGFAALASICADPGDANGRQLWVTQGTDQDYGGGGAGSSAAVYGWEPSCQSSHVVGNPTNTGPAYVLTSSGYHVPLDGYLDSCLFGNPFFWELFGPSPIACDGTYVYVVWLYYPGTDTGSAQDADGASPNSANQLQWIVTRWPIVRNGSPCPTYLTPIFHTKFKIDERVDEGVLH